MTKAYTTDADLYRDAIAIWGRDAQLEMLIEECAELIVALKQWQRRRVKIEDVVNEIADVEIMIEQARMIIGDSSVNDVKRSKLYRLETRLLEAQR